MLISKSRYLSLFNGFFWSTKYFIIFGKDADQAPHTVQGTEELFVMAWVVASEVKILQPLAEVASESTMNLTYQTVMWSCYKPGKILSNAQGKNVTRRATTHSERLPEQGTKCREEKTKYHVIRSVWTVVFWSRKWSQGSLSRQFCMQGIITFTDSGTSI